MNTWPDTDIAQQVSAKTICSDKNGIAELFQSIQNNENTKRSIATNRFDSVIRSVIDHLDLTFSEIINDIPTDLESDIPGQFYVGKHNGYNVSVSVMTDAQERQLKFIISINCGKDSTLTNLYNPQTTDYRYETRRYSVNHVGTESFTNSIIVGVVCS